MLAQPAAFAMKIYIYTAASKTRCFGTTMNTNSQNDSRLIALTIALCCVQLEQ